MTDPANALKAANKLKKEGRTDEALRLVGDALAREALDPMGVDKAGRWLLRTLGADSGGLNPQRVLLLGQCTTSWLRTSLAAVSFGRGRPALVDEGEYDSVVQEIMHRDAGSTDVVVLVPWTQRLLGGERTDAARIDDELAFWEQAWAGVSGKLGAKLVMVGYDTATVGSEGLFIGGAAGKTALIRKMNQALRSRLPEGAYYVDLDRVAGDVGRRRFYDMRRYFWTKQPFSELGTVELCKQIEAGIRALSVGPRKVLVLDLDNTLWGGVVGEEGPLGVALGDSPDGEAFRAFQRHCKALSTRGVLLTVSSKNNDADAREPFEQNPDMVLKLDDFAAFEANWQPKSMAIEQMAADLRLGLDSFVFFDDNPVEREQVRQALPMVAVVDVPDDPSEYVRALERGMYFEAVSVTDADRKRSAQYQTERKRREAKTSFTDIGAYLDSLGMTAVVEPVQHTNLQRVVQLIGKTNQFNLTTRRHPRELVESLAEDPRAIAMALRISDKFGDHGLVSVLLGIPEDEHTIRIDTWLMSCRVIARRVEHFAFGVMLERARELGYTRMVGEYIKTKKNAQVAELYTSLGFTAAAAAGDVHRFEADAGALQLPDSPVRRV